MLQLKNSVAMLALVAVACIAPPPTVAQDQPAAEPAEDLKSLVNSLSPDDPAVADDVIPLPEVELLTEAELDELVAPVALYPDALLAQVLVASTFPLQVVKADRIIAESEDLSDEALSETLSEQDFDPSVLVLLSGFPTVIERMATDLDWTEQLGIAMLQQDDDVLAAVQRMRADARDMGYLSSNDAQAVEEEEGQIYIAPTDPEVVYVPTYDPSVVYTSPAPAEPYYVAPAQSTSPWSAQSLLTGGVIGFGSALLVNELWGDDDDDDDDDDDWDGYWRRPQPIAWQDREFYPRPYWNRNRAEQARTWDWERDRYWRRSSDDRWRREAARDRRDAERDRIQALGRMGDPARVRAARESGHWRAIEEQESRERRAARAREERRELESRQERRQVRQREERREAVEQQERRDANQDAKRREAAEQRQRREAREKAERREAAESRENRERREARENAERREAAEAREQRQRSEAAADRENRAKAQRAEGQQRERAEAKRRAARQQEEGRQQQQEQRQRAEQGGGGGQQGGGNNASGQQRQDQKAKQNDDGGKGKNNQRCRDDDKDCN